MKKPTTRGAVLAGTTLLAATLLTGCAGEKHTFNSLEVSSLDKTIEALDASWSQHRANGTAATVDDGSHCFVQTAKDGVLADKALCGPVHYLGDDQTGWDSVALQASPDGKDKVTLAGGDSFSKDKPNANTALYRTDGKKAADNANLAEPDSKSADQEKALWDAAGNNTGSSSGTRSVDVITPDGTVTVVAQGVTDRVGNASNRLKAGDRRKFATVSITSRIGDSSNSSNSSWGMSSAPDVQPKTDLAFVTGGKSYPIGQVKSGTVSMSLPGDGSDVALAVGYGDFKQTVTLNDGTLHTTATALYDGYGTQSRATIGQVQVGDGSANNAFFATLGQFTLTAERSAYDAKNGWAPEGKAWLRLSGTPSINGPGYYTSGSLGRSDNSYHGPTTIKSATVTGVSGAKFDGELKAQDSKDDGSAYSNGMILNMLFLVPANNGDFSVSMVVNNAGKADGVKSSGFTAPPSSNVDLTVPAVQLSFTKTK